MEYQITRKLVINKQPRSPLLPFVSSTGSTRSSVTSPGAICNWLSIKIIICFLFDVTDELT